MGISKMDYGAKRDMAAACGSKLMALVDHLEDYIDWFLKKHANEGKREEIEIMISLPYSVTEAASEWPEAGRKQQANFLGMRLSRDEENYREYERHLRSLFIHWKIKISKSPWTVFITLS